jgi:hypothetical protein
MRFLKKRSEKKDTGLQGGLKLRLAPNLAKSEVSEFHSIFPFVADISLAGFFLKKICDFSELRWAGHHLQQSLAEFGYYKSEREFKTFHHAFH